MSHTSRLSCDGRYGGYPRHLSAIPQSAEPTTEYFPNFLAKQAFRSPEPVDTVHQYPTIANQIVQGSTIRPPAAQPCGYEIPQRGRSKLIMGMGNISGRGSGAELIERDGAVGPLFRQAGFRARLRPQTGILDRRGRQRSAGSRNRLLHNHLVLLIPIKPSATPVGLCRHDAHNSMRETMVYCGVRLLT